LLRLLFVFGIRKPALAASLRGSVQAAVFVGFQDQRRDRGGAAVVPVQRYVSERL
jgi:hypothetical protein